MRYLLIFDWDGTLFNGVPVKRALGVSQMSHALEVPPMVAEKFFNATMGMPFNKQAEYFYEHVRHKKPPRGFGEKMRRAFYAAIPKRIQNSKLFPYSKGALIKLHDAGHALALTTADQPPHYIIILKRAGLEKLFSRMFDSRYSQYKRVMINRIVRELRFPKNKVFYIGDGTTDMREARAAGVRGIGVLGTFSPGELRRAGASLVVRNVSELPALVEKLARR
ncbi:MAG TPA: HAD family hydrolase [Candidatus Norongarragalinales archaeon]|jgi:phosphoglycolate phosphatase-like HAD superfamily hydrolase|nr:HAD family hydrolase [Candidatus Norongarragalinales archaeon]